MSDIYLRVVNGADITLSDPTTAGGATYTLTCETNAFVLTGIDVDLIHSRVRGRHRGYDWETIAERERQEQARRALQRDEEEVLMAIAIVVATEDLAA